MAIARVLLAQFFLLLFAAAQKERHYDYIKKTLERLCAQGNLPVFVDPPQTWQLGLSATCTNNSPNPDDYFRPRLIIWEPLMQCSLTLGQLRCSKMECVSSEMSFLRPVRWKDGANSANAPRTLFGCKGSTLLVSRVYRCPRNHEILAHDEEILKLFPQRDRLPFILSHSGGITRELFEYIISLSSSGLKISQIESMLGQQKLEDFYARRQMMEEDTKIFGPAKIKEITDNYNEMPKECKSPSNDFISLCITNDYLTKETLYRQCMSQTTCTWFCCDHTFKIASNVGILRKSDRKWEKQYNSVFFIMNEHGVVLTWQLTKGTGFAKVSDLFTALKQRFIRQGKTVDMCVIDNCCSWRNKLQTVFGSQLKVLLDLFHAVQRVVKCIPKKHPFAYRCCQSFRKVFRHLSDNGEVRALPTPPPNIMENNLNVFLKSWKDISYNSISVLSIKALKEIENLRSHIRKGCLSDLPPGCGTEQNENMHKCIRQAVTRGRMGVLLAVSLISSFLYTWNEKRLNAANSNNVSIVRPLISRRKELLNNRPITDETFGIGVSNHNPLSLDSLQLPYRECDASSDGLIPLLDNKSDSEGESSPSLIDSSVLNQLIIRANNLFILKERTQAFTSSLDRNSKHFHLMNTNALFSFGSLTAENLDFVESNKRLNDVLKGYGFERVEVNPDGDCLFESVIFQIYQVLSSNKDFLNHLLALGLGPFYNKSVVPKSHVTKLRELMVEEWLANWQEYEGYVSGINGDYEEIVTKYKKLGVFHGEFGNLMAPSLLNVLKVNIVILTSMENFPVIPVSPRCQVCTKEVLIIAFNHAGDGHYDPVIEVQANDVSPESVSKEKLPKEQEKDSKDQQNGCRCGKGAASKFKKSLDGGKIEQSFCFQVPGRRRTMCPCYRAFQPCTSKCNCSGYLRPGFDLLLRPPAKVPRSRVHVK